MSPMAFCAARLRVVSRAGQIKAKRGEERVDRRLRQRCAGGEQDAYSCLPTNLSIRPPSHHYSSTSQPLQPALRRLL